MDFVEFFNPETTQLCRFQAKKSVLMSISRFQTVINNSNKKEKFLEISGDLVYKTDGEVCIRTCV